MCCIHIAVFEYRFARSSAAPFLFVLPENAWRSFLRRFRHLGMKLFSSTADRARTYFPYSRRLPQGSLCRSGEVHSRHTFQSCHIADTDPFFLPETDPPCCPSGHFQSCFPSCGRHRHRLWAVSSYGRCCSGSRHKSVSYTHLTLPTILLV